MLKLPKILFFLLLSPAMFCQDWVWARTANYCSGNQRVKAIKADSSGNIYLLGENDIEANYDNYRLAVGTFVLKYSASGTLLWAQNISFKADKIEISSDENIFLSCNYKEKIRIGQTEHLSAGEEDVLILKMSPDGIVHWSRSFGGSMQDKVNNIQADRNGNIYLTGKSFSKKIDFLNTLAFDTNNVGGYFLMKIDAAGDPQWITRGIQDSVHLCFDEGHLITIDKRDRIYTIGKAGRIEGAYGAHFLSVFDATGKLLRNSWWTPNYFGYNLDLLEVDQNFNLYYSSGTNGPHSGPPHPQKFDSTEIRKWAFFGGTQYGCYSFYHPRVNLLNETVNILGCIRQHEYGCLSDSVRLFDNLSLPVQGESDILIFQLDSVGNIKWHKLTGGSGSDKPVCSVFDRMGNFYVAGTFNKPLFFDEEFLLNTGNTTQVFLAKMGKKSKTNFNESEFPVIKICELDLYPNPANQDIYLSTDCELHELRVYDPTGSLLIELKDIREQKTLNVSDAAKGLYIVKARFKEQMIIKKIVVR